MDFKEIKKSNLHIEEYIFLYMLYKEEDWNEYPWLLDKISLQQMIHNLEQQLWIINGESGYMLRNKGLELFDSKDTQTVSFDIFWNVYHTVTHLAKTDKDATIKYWKKLKPKEKIKAIENVQLYYDSLNDKKFCRKARTYLENKNFNDEFKSRETNSPFTLAGNS